MYKCGKEAEATHYLSSVALQLPYILQNRTTESYICYWLPIKIYPEGKLPNTLLYWSLNFNHGKNQNILNKQLNIW